MKSRLIGIIAAVCVILIAGIVILNINSSSKKSQQLQTAEASIPEYVPQFDSYDEEYATIMKAKLRKYLKG